MTKYKHTLSCNWYESNHIWWSIDEKTLNNLSIYLSNIHKYDFIFTWFYFFAVRQFFNIQWIWEYDWSLNFTTSIKNDLLTLIHSTNASWCCMMLLIQIRCNENERKKTWITTKRINDKCTNFSSECLFGHFMCTTMYWCPHQFTHRNKCTSVFG